MTSREKAFGDEKAGGAQVMSSEDGAQIFVFRSKEP